MKSPLRNGFLHLGTALIATLLALALPAAASALPSDRGYEKVSPDEKDTADILPLGFAAAEGSGVAYGSFGGFGDSQGTSAAAHFFSERGADAWSTHGTTPATDPIFGLGDTIPVAYGEDAATVVFQVVGFKLPGNTNNDRNLFRINPDGSATLMSIGAPDAGGIFYRSPKANEDASVVTWNVDNDAPFQVTKGPEAPAERNNSYVSDGTDLWIANVLPDGTTYDQGSRVAGINDDGSRIFWRNRTGGAELYAWNEDGPTTHVSASQRTVPDPDPVHRGNDFEAMTPDGSVVFFSSGNKLTDDAVDGSNLYRYDFADGELTDLTTSTPDAGVGGVLDITDDAERIYFTARGVLTPDATPDVNHIYRLDGEQLTLVTDLGRIEGLNEADARMTPDGNTLLFRSPTQLTGYDNAGTEQLYRWDAGTEALQCVSCNPSGEAPSGDVLYESSHLPIAGIMGNLTTRNLSADGSRVFFTSPDALVNADTNGRLDTYIWEQGPGGGSIDLLSSGTSSSDSLFVDASANGDDAYFVTRSQLVGTDTDVAADIYDARVGGGLASQIAPPTEIPCEGGDCKPQATGPVPEPSPGTGAVRSDPEGGERCLGLDRKLERAHRKADRSAKKARSAKQKAKRLDRKAKRADGKRGKRLRKKAKRAERKVKHLRKRRRKANRKAGALERRASRCEREAGR